MPFEPKAPSLRALSHLSRLLNGPPGAQVGKSYQCIRHVQRNALISTLPRWAQPSFIAFKQTAHRHVQSRTFTSTSSHPSKTKHRKTLNKSDPFDVTQLQADIDQTIEQLKTDLAKLRGGGRFNHDVVEALRVQPLKSSKETVKLGNLAQVLPKSRYLHVVVGEPEHIKPVASAIAASPHSLVPQMPKEEAPTTLTVPIPPPTGDARQLTIKSAKNAMATATSRVKAIRQQHRKMLQTLKQEDKVRPDDFRKAEQLMEKIIEKSNKEVKKIGENAQRTLESS